MTNHLTPEHRSAIAGVRERYIKTFKHQGVTKAFDRRYVTRAQGYIEAYPGLRLKQHRVSNLTAYLNKLLQKNGSSSPI